MYYQLFTARNGGSMQSQVVTQPVTVTSLSGNVVVVNAQGQARIVNAGDVLRPDEIIITVNQSEIALQTIQGDVQVGRTAWRACQSSQQMDSRKCKLHPFKVKSTLI